MSSCNSVKRVAEKEQLLKMATILIDGKKNRDLDLNNYILQKPNSRLLGLPISLYFYNLGNPKTPKTPREWGGVNPKRYNFFKQLFSEKQSIAVAKSSINFNNWLLKNGESPVIIDDFKTKKTVKNLNTYFKTIGFWNNTVVAKIASLKNKKGAITYHVKKNTPLYLDTITTDILSSTLKAIYQRDTIHTFLRKGTQYNQQLFINEVNRIVKLFRNSGIYNFSDSYIYFDEVDTLRIKTNVITTISENAIEIINGIKKVTPFQIQKIAKVNVYTDYSFNKEGQSYLDSISYQGIKFFAHEKIKYNPKYLSQSIFIRKNQIYSDTLRNSTRKHLKSLNNFKTISIKYIPIKNTDLLIANIRLTPQKKYTIGAETELTHSNIRQLGISGKFSATNRNSFKGAELFKFSFTGSFFNTSNQSGSTNGFFNAWELGVDLSLEIPRFFAPFGLNRLVPKEMSPKTLFSIGTGIQKNIGLDRQTINANISYNWKFNKRKSINFELFNIQYIRNLNNGEYFNIYNSEYNKLLPIATAYNNFNSTTSSTPPFIVTRSNAPSLMKLIKTDTNFQTNNSTEYNDNLNINNRYTIITSNFIIPTIAYTFTYNSQSNYKDNNFSFFKVRVANSGNFVALLTKKTNENGLKIIADTPIAQYFKTDLEYKKFWNISRSSVLGFRSFLGAIFTYGKSQVPFTKSYFAGGSNDIRAWQTYELGPGSSTPGLEYNVGDFKFLTSLEYRFDLISSLKGALFIDAGNIWDISNSRFTAEEEKFNSFSSLKQIAVGSGFGARYDFNFLILRLDIGFKTHEPYLNGNKWFKNFNFNNAVYNIGINYPF
jgi:hypothetical protein